MLQVLHTEKTLLNIKRKCETKQKADSEDNPFQDSTETPGKKLRGDSSLSNQPSPKVSPTTLPYIVYGKQEHKNVVGKYWISETTELKPFLLLLYFS